MFTVVHTCGVFSRKVPSQDATATSKGIDYLVGRDVEVNVVNIDLVSASTWIKEVLLTLVHLLHALPAKHLHLSERRQLATRCVLWKAAVHLSHLVEHHAVSKHLVLLL